MTRVATLTGPSGHIATFSSNDNGPWPRLDLMDISGWFGGVGVKDQPSPRLGHGMFDNPTRFTGRAPTIYAFTQYETPEQRNILERGFSTMLADGEEYDLRVEIDGFALSCVVQQDGEISVRRAGINGLDIMIPLRSERPQLFADPVKYQVFPGGFGEGLEYPLFADDILSFGDVSPGTGVPIRNGGTVTAWPRIEVHGTWPSGFRITSGTRAVEFGVPVFSSSPVEIDMLRGTVMVNGSDWTQALTRRQWFGVEPGQAIQPRLSAIGQGTGWADIYLSDTYQ